MVIVLKGTYSIARLTIGQRQIGTGFDREIPVYCIDTDSDGVLVGQPFACIRIQRILIPSEPVCCVDEHTVIHLYLYPPCVQHSRLIVDGVGATFNVQHSRLIVKSDWVGMDISCGKEKQR